MAKNGDIVSRAEYYPNGKPRIKYAIKYDSTVRSVFQIKKIQGEAWTPKGKSTGKIINGNGEWTRFPDGADSAEKSVFREVYKDSLMIKGEKIDSAEIAKWLK